MNTESDLDWVPFAGHRLRKVGVEFDVVRVTGELGRRAADLLDSLLVEGCGPVIEEVSGAGHLYFLCPPGSTGGRVWPRHALRLGGPGTTSYVGVPALMGRTWPLAWRYRPPADGTWCHAVMLHSVLSAQARQLPVGRTESPARPSPGEQPDEPAPDPDPGTPNTPERHSVPEPAEAPATAGEAEGPEPLGEGWGMVV
jgi:hypothetical protein